ncbi:MAG: hypothetical protein KTR28_08980 [Micavibrio sp.]|nr:hypothetical protein [Micavibrio sp.]
MSFLSSNKTVLLVSDDALYIYAATGKNVKLIEAVPWSAQNFIENVSTIIAKDCGRRPVLLLNDMVEQHYRKERLIKTGVSTFDRSTMLKRRLSVAFGKYPVRAALPLKEKIAKTNDQPASDVYIFAAIPDTEQLEKSMGAVRKSMASISGLCLLPVESADMVKTLSAKLAPRNSKKALWSIFIGQHHSGSLRQVVTKNGELALTRMSPMTMNRQDPSLWAQEVYKEFKATMSYLSRFGYEPDEGLDVTIISDINAAEHLQNIVKEDCNLNVLNVFDAAKALGLSLGHPHEPDFADPLHIAWAAKKARLALPMKAGSVDEVHRPRQIAMAASLLLLCGAAYLGYEAMNKFGELSTVYSNLDSARTKQSTLQAQYDVLINRKEEMGFDVRVIQSAISVYDQFEANNIDALGLFKGMGRALGKDLRIDGVELLRPAGSNVQGVIAGFVDGMQGNVPQGPPIFKAHMKMTYPGTTDVDKGNAEVKSLSERLSQVMPQYEVEVVKYLKDYGYTEGLVVETGDLEQENLQQDFVAEIVVKGLPPRKEEGAMQ